MLRFGLSVFLGLLISLGAVAETLTMQQKLNDFDQLNFMIQSQYGPYQYKKNVIGLDLDGIEKKYRAEIESTKTNAEFYYLLIRYVAEYRDGHFGIYVPSTRVRSVPVMTDLVDGKVLIDSIDEDELDKKDFPFTRGDEIISVDGQPIKEFLEDMRRYRSDGQVLGQTRVAARQVFRRSAMVVPVPQKESVTVEIRHGNSEIIESATLKWEDDGDGLDETEKSPALSLFGLSGLNIPSAFSQLSTRDTHEVYLGKNGIERSYQCSGKTRIAMPKDAVQIVKEPFVAYYHPTPKGNVGYLRIPHYSWRDGDEPGSEALVMEKYIYALQVLEKNTVGLIIDQDHNCGGSVEFVENMVGLFVDHPVETMRFELRANKLSVLELDRWTEAVSPDTIQGQHIAGVSKLVKDTWKKGDFLTPKTGLINQTTFPAAIRYTKPVVITIDEMSGSGGDGFPSLMKGHGRAKLVGHTTAGLGGHVSEMPALNNSAMQIRMTMSLFYRPDGVAVENNGAVPDVDYVITRDDFMYGYKAYQQFYEKVLLDMIP